MRQLCYCSAALALLLTIGATAGAQRAGGVTLGINGNGVAIGNVPRVNGIRLNFRDRDLEVVNGINATIWVPYGQASGDVNGIALGLPATGAGRITGLAVAVVGAGASESIRGIGVAPIGIGAGQSMWGLMVGGIGVGAGEEFTGIGLGGVGVGAGGRIRGLMVGGVGVGGGADVQGISVGGFGVGGGGNVQGLSVAGFGVGGGGDVRGISIAGFGVGSGGNVTGLSLAGFGVGSGGTLRGISVAGVGVGAPKVRGIALASAVGGEDVVGGVIAPFYFRIARGGYFNGIALSSVTHVTGEQRGVTIGIVNYARRLRGLQIGALNYARDNPRAFRLLPLVNFHID